MAGISLRPAESPALRHATRLLSMVHELHKAGYQRVRLSAGMAPSGLYWRCAITHAANMADDLTVREPTTDTLRYTTGDADRYFGWADAPGRSARELAALFLDRCPTIAARGTGQDWCYAGWLTEALGRAERGGTGALPVFFADYPVTLDPAVRPPLPPAA